MVNTGLTLFYSLRYLYVHHYKGTKEYFGQTGYEKIAEFMAKYHDNNTCIKEQNITYDTLHTTYNRV